MSDPRRYFDMDGEPISLEEWAHLYEDFDRRTLARDEIDTSLGRLTVLTVWTGIRDPEEVRSALGRSDDLFRTGLLDAHKNFLREVGNYPDKRAALEGHRRVIDHLRTDTLPPDTQPE